MENNCFSTINFIALINKIKQKANIQFYENTYIKDINHTYSDYNSEINLNGRTYLGRGVSHSANLALTKALFESVERTLIPFNSLQTSSGVAVSSDLALSKQIAKNELIERHLFLNHWQKMIPFIKIDSSITKRLITEFYSKYSKTIQITFYRTIFLENNCCIICIISGLKYKNSPFGAILGLAYKNDLQQSVLHAFFEALTHFSHDLENNKLSENLSIEDFYKLNIHKFSDHGKLAKNVDYFSEFSKMFPNNYIKSMISISSTLNFNYIALKDPFDLGLQAISCVSDDIIKLYCGLPTEASNYVNKKPHIIN